MVRGQGQRDGENTTLNKSVKIYSRCVLEEEVSSFSLKQYFLQVTHYGVGKDLNKVHLLPAFIILVNIDKLGGQFQNEGSFAFGATVF